MADANRIAAALRYQQDMEGPVTMNPNIAEQGRKGRANMAPPTSVMDLRSRDYERRARETENFLIGADILFGALPFAPLAKGAVMAAGRYAGPELARGLENYMAKSGAVLPMDVWHGSPHRFPPTAKNPLGEFDPMKIGTGEGAQAYGHGLYLAQNPKVASEYAEKLTNPEVLFGGKKLNEISDPMTAKTAKWISDNVGVMQTDARAAEAKRLFSRLPMEQQKALGIPEITTTGYLYKVDLPDEHIAKMLDWDKPLSQQHPDVHAVALKRLEELRAMGGSIPKDPTGEWIHKAFGPQGAESAANGLYGQSAASVRLREAGIPGIRYLDGGSRTGGAGTSNFVVFDDQLPKIIGRE